MRPDGLWHPRLSALVAAMGHSDTLVVADPGLPVPPGVETIDLVWKRGERACCRCCTACSTNSWSSRQCSWAT